MKFNTVTIRDPALNHIEGATLLVPDGWRIEGGFVWMPLFLIQANLLLRVSDPETSAATEMLPLQQYAWLTPPAPMPIGQNYLGRRRSNLCVIYTGKTGPTYWRIRSE